MSELGDATLKRKQEKAMENPTRRAILELLEGGRELPSTTIRQELGGDISLSCVGYHLSVLEEAELVEPDSDGRAARVFSRAA